MTVPNHLTTPQEGAGVEQLGAVEDGEPRHARRRHQDPHGDPRNDDVALRRKLRFYAEGVIVDVHGGAPYWTFRCPRHPEHDPGCG